MNKRVPTLDLAKTLSIIFMVFVHVYETSYCPQLVGEYNAVRKFFCSLIEFLGGIPSAGIFILIMGFLVGWSSSKTPEKLLKESVILFLVGICVNIFACWIPLFLSGYTEKYFHVIAPKILANDIYFFDALALICLSFVLSLKKEVRIKAASIMIVLSLVISHLLNAFVSPTGNNWVDSILGLFVRLNSWSYFPLFNWLPFPLAGFICGKIFRERKEAGKEFTAKHFIISTLAGIIMVTFAFLMMKTKGIKDSICFGSEYTGEDYYNILGFNLMEGAGIIVILMNLYSIVSKKIRGPFLDVITFISRNIRSIYPIQWLIIGLLNLSLRNVTDLRLVFLISIGVLSATIVLTLGLNSLKKVIYSRRKSL